jgi:hypothetical protein
MPSSGNLWGVAIASKEEAAFRTILIERDLAESAADCPFERVAQRYCIDRCRFRLSDTRELTVNSSRSSCVMSNYIMQYRVIISLTEQTHSILA